MGPRVMRRSAQIRPRLRRPTWQTALLFRRPPGFDRKPLQGLPYSAEFMSDYEAALTGQPVPVGVNTARPGTMRALAFSYFVSPEFRTLRLSTQRAYRGTIERLCAEHGGKRAADLRREHVVRLMAARAEHPGAANALRMALRVHDEARHRHRPSRRRPNP